MSQLQPPPIPEPPEVVGLPPVPEPPPVLADASLGPDVAWAPMPGAALMELIETTDPEAAVRMRAASGEPGLQLVPATVQSALAAAIPGLQAIATGNGPAAERIAAVRELLRVAEALGFVGPDRAQGGAAVAADALTVRALAVLESKLDSGSTAVAVQALRAAAAATRRGP